MRSGRWMGAVAGALALAAGPGALRLAPDPRPPHRAAPWSVDGVEIEPAALAQAPLGDEVAITPPDDTLAGPLAPAAPAPPPFQAAADGRAGVYALVVGIDDYPGSGSDLQSAVADADTVEAALTGFGVPAANRVVLRDGQARKPELVAAIQALVRTAGPASTVVLAYAGHVRKLDGDTEAIVAADGGLLPDTELAALLAPSPAARMWVLLATCYAGGFTEVVGPGRILTGAADASSLAYESRSINGSYLVHHLVREGWLEGRAGRSVQEAFAYADARISEERSQRRPVQVDQVGAPLVLGPGDPSAGRTTAAAQPAPPPPAASEPPPSSPPPPPSQSPPTTDPPERSCTLAVVLCREE